LPDNTRFPEIEIAVLSILTSFPAPVVPLEIVSVPVNDEEVIIFCCPVEAEAQVKLPKVCPLPPGVEFVTPVTEQVEAAFQVAVGIVPPFKPCT
jgi:hypothetical protein